MTDLKRNFNKIFIKNLSSLFFIIVTIWNASLILSVSYFVTLDGPTSVYSSNIFNQLFNENLFFKNFFQINWELIPNWTGHLLLAILNQFFDSEIAEKAIQLSIIIGLPISFRYYLSKTSVHYQWTSFLIFPFTYGILFFLGLYTFLLGIILMLFSLGWWYGLSQDKPKIQHYLFLSILILALYFTHLIAFGLFLILTSWHILLTHIQNQKRTWVYRGIAILKSGGYLFLTALIPVFLTFKYYHSRIPTRQIEYFSWSEISIMIAHIQPVIALNQEVEQNFTFYIGILYLVLSLYVIGYFVQLIYKKKYVKNNQLFHLGILLIVLIFVFFIPDSDGFGWSATIRFIFLSFLFFIALLASLYVPKFIQLLAVCISLVTHFLLLDYYKPHILQLNETVKEVKLSLNQIEDNSVILPINKTDNWLKGRMPNYLATDRPIVVLENYQAWFNYFPIMWEEKSFPKLRLSGKNNDHFQCMSWRSTHWNNPKEIDYVFLFEPQSLPKDPCWQDLTIFLNSNFISVSQGPNHILYQKK